MQSYINVYVREALSRRKLENVNNDKSDVLNTVDIIPMVTFTDMMSDRPILWLQEYDYKPNGQIIFARDVNGKISINPQGLVNAFNDIINIYNLRKQETINLYKNKGITVIEDNGEYYLTVLNIDGQPQRITLEDKDLYWGLINKYHYNIKSETVLEQTEDGNIIQTEVKNIVAGNSYTFNNATIPQSLIEKKI